MRIKKIWSVYFSPTGGTKHITNIIAKQLSISLGCKFEEINITRPENREKQYTFFEEDLVVIGSPVYAGRIPNKIMPDYKACFHGEKAKAVTLCTYGNRSAGDALTELRTIMSENGFTILGAAALVSAHAFTDVIAKGRPDEQDHKQINQFAMTLSKAIREGTIKPLELSEDESVGPYYTPKQEDGTPAKFLKAKPCTDTQKCTQCQKCANVCPLNSIDRKDCTKVPGICIKCQACIKVCPVQAKHFEDKQLLSHVRMVEKNFTKRADNKFLCIH